MSTKVGDTTFHYKRICLSVEVAVGVDRSGELVSDEALKRAIQAGFNEYTDGRRMFSVELFQDGLIRLLKSSIQVAVYEDACRRYPNRSTLDGTSIACKLTDAKLENLHGFFSSGNVQVVELKSVDKG